MEQVTPIPISKMTDEEIKQELKDYGVKVHHKTGTAKLAELLADVRKNPSAVTQDITTEAPINDRPYKDGLPGASKAAIEAATKHFELTPEQAAMRLIRVVVTPNDPLMASYPGLIFTVGVSGINNGKMIKKYVPFNNEEGWHVPNIILRQIEHAEMQKFKTITTPNGEKVLEPYITKKFNVRILDPLTPEEMDKLAASQAANPAFHQGAN
tara:strand:- start:20208 stop:20840 length:633 start_codon:yes stop_codon:yes gene_type:complete